MVRWVGGIGERKLLFGAPGRLRIDPGSDGTHTQPAARPHRRRHIGMLIAEYLYASGGPDADARTQGLAVLPDHTHANIRTALDRSAGRTLILAG